MRKLFRNVVLSLVALLLAAMIVDSIEREQKYEKRRTAVEGMLNVEAKMLICRLIFESTGQVICSDRQLDATYYYPIVTNGWAPVELANLKWSGRSVGQRIVYTGVTEYDRYRFPSQLVTDDISDDNRTRLLAQTYLSGIRSLLTNISEIRDTYLAYGSISDQERHHIKALPAPPGSWDLPYNNTTLAEYDRYLC